MPKRWFRLSRTVPLCSQLLLLKLLGVTGLKGLPVLSWSQALAARPTRFKDLDIENPSKTVPQARFRPPKELKSCWQVGFAKISSCQRRPRGPWA